MSETLHAGLLTGPRGRRLCFALVAAADSLWTLAVHATATPSEQNTRALIGAIEQSNPAITDGSLLAALADAVDNARYWQPPDETDVLLATERVRAALEPTALRIAASAETDWWHSPVALDDQHYVQFTPDFGAPETAGAAARLARWGADTRREEQRAAAESARANSSGSWWSTPALVQLPTTTRGRPALGALKLRAMEDAFGWTEADVWPLRPGSAPRVYEITGPSAWSRLVERFPLGVAASRLQDWRRTTGDVADWRIPDWEAVASAYDAVHLTVAGYLATAGRSLPAGEGRTALAGWDPDETYWLTDLLENAGDPVSWHHDADRTWVR
jgi:hypothetical protein